MLVPILAYQGTIAARWKPIPIDRKYQDQHQRQPEARYRHAQNRDQPCPHNPAACRASTADMVPSDQ